MNPNPRLSHVRRVAQDRGHQRVDDTSIVRRPPVLSERRKSREEREPQHGRQGQMRKGEGEVRDDITKFSE